MQHGDDLEVGVLEQVVVVCLLCLQKQAVQGLEDRQPVAVRGTLGAEGDGGDAEGRDPGRLTWW